MTEWVSAVQIKHIHLDEQFVEHQIWKTMKTFARMAGAYDGMAPDAFGSLLEGTERFVDHGRFGHLGASDLPMLAEVANWNAYNLNLTTSGEMTTPRPQEIVVVNYLPDYDINRFHLEYGGGRSLARATVHMKGLTPYQTTLEIRTSDPIIMDECETEWDNKDSHQEENRRSIKPLRDAFGPRFEAGGPEWRDMEDSNLLYDSL